MTAIPPQPPALERLGSFFMIWMGCFLLFNLLASGLLLLIYGEEVYQVIANYENPQGDNLQIMRVLHILLSIGIFGIPPAIFVLMNKPKDWAFFRLSSVPPFKLLLLTILVMALVSPLVFWALEVNQSMNLPSAFRTLEQYLRDMESKNERMLQVLLTMNTPIDLMINLLMIAIVPAFVEELLFRGTLQQLLAKTFGDVHSAIIITGVFFSFIHFQFYGFFPRMMLGILFGYLFWWSGNLWLPIIGHFLNNGVQVVMVYLFQQGKIELNIDEIDGFHPVVIMISTVLLFITLFIFDLASQKKQVAGDGKRLG